MISKIKIGLILIFQGLLRSALAADWSYVGSNGVNYWNTVYANDCGKSSQSPISLPPWIEMRRSTDLVPFVFNEFNTGKTVLMKNNGHAVQGDMPAGSQVSGGGLGDTYKTAQFHFHWGSDLNRGSEHTYNGKTYPAEVHIVNYNTKYNSLGEAANKVDGLAVLGAFLEVGPIHNCKFAKMIDSLKNISAKGANQTIEGFKLDYLLPTDTSKYFRYKGSLTTPNCYESVTWTVFFNKIYISEEQLAMFRTVYKDDSQTNPLVDNWRPPQPLNGRTVYISFDVSISGASPMPSATGLLLLCISLTYKFIS